MKRSIFVVGAVLALIVGVSTANADGNAANARNCQQAGYVNYVTTDGTTFNNAGECIRYAALGGTLVPLLPDLVLGSSCSTGSQFAGCDFTVTNQGNAPAMGTIQLNATLHSTNPLGFVVADGFPFPFPGCGDSGGFVTTTDAAKGVFCTGTFAPGATVPFIISISGQVAPPGTEITITGTVDPDNLIPESNENNNTFNQTFTLT
jgi:CARDB protein